MKSKIILNQEINSFSQRREMINIPWFDYKIIVISNEYGEMIANIAYFSAFLWVSLSLEKQLAMHTEFEEKLALN